MGRTADEEEVGVVDDMFVEGDAEVGGGGTGNAFIVEDDDDDAS
jgi:hypothetical protein